jgi:CubicO group peptidase (beta-lactamase class C family)
LPVSGEERFEQLRAVVRDAMQRAHAPGAAIGVLHGDRQDAAGFGVTSLEHPLAVTAETLFQTGSISKTFTATAALCLVERGVLDLDAPVRRYLPDLRLIDDDVAQRVTTRHLLTHTGGWLGDYFDDPGRGEDALTRMVAVLGELPQVTPLGGHWSYSNSGFYLAGRVIEVATDAPFEVVVRREVFEPLGMEMSFYFPEEVMTHRFAVGHRRGTEGTELARPWELARAAHPAGGVISAVGDLLRYARFHLDGGIAPDGRQLIPRELLAAMHQPRIEIGDESMALAWFGRTFGGERVLHHGGATTGQRALLWLVPGRELAIAGFVNHDEGNQVLNESFAAAMQLYLGLEQPDPDPLPTDPAAAAELAGRYTAAAADLELTLDGEDLVLQVTLKGGFPRRDSPPPPVQPDPARMAFIGPDRLMVLEGPAKGSRTQVIREEGKVAWLRHSVRIYRRADD